MQTKNLPTRLLAIDTATGPCGVAVFEGDVLRTHAQENGKSQQARALVPMIEAALAQAGIGYGDITQIVTTVGPGGFTGLRIGLAAAKAIAFAGGIPIAGVSTLACVAYDAPADKVLALVNAGKGEAYAQGFSRLPQLQPLTEPMIVGAEQVEALVREGYTAAGYYPFSHNGEEINAIQAGMLALTQPHLLMAAEPFYIRPPDAIPMQTKPFSM